MVLKRASIRAGQLLRFCVTFIRPGLEYAAPVCHPGFKQHLSDQAESVQRLSLRSIYRNLSYRQALEATGLPELLDRRLRQCL